MTEIKNYSKGTVIFEENSWELAMYDIKSGKVGIYANYGKEDEKLLTELESGRYFGEMGVIDAMPRTATAVALEDTETAVIDSEDFTTYFADDPEKVLDIYQKLCGRLRELSASYMEACAAVTEYVESRGDTKPKGLMAKIKELLSANEQYANMMPSAHLNSFTSVFVPREIDGIWYF